MRCVNSLSSIRTRKALACAIVIDPCMSGRRRGVRPIGGLVVTAQLRAQQQQQQQQCPPSERSAPQLQRPLRQLNNALPKARKAPQSPVSQLQATNLDTTPRGGLLAPAPAVNAAANAEQPSEAQLAKTGTARGSVIGAVALITGGAHHRCIILCRLNFKLSLTDERLSSARLWLKVAWHRHVLMTPKSPHILIMPKSPHSADTTGAWAVFVGEVQSVPVLGWHGRYTRNFRASFGV